MFLLKKLFCFVACFMMIKWTFLHPGQSDEKALTTGSRWGPIFPRGSNFFQGVSNCLFPIETILICDFAEGVRTPAPPLLDPHLVQPSQLHGWLRLQYIISFGLGKR